MGVRRDERRGHFVLDLVPDGAIEREVVAVDLGPVLHVRTSGAHLTPDEARELADALTWWAERKEHWAGSRRGFIDRRAV